MNNQSTGLTTQQTGLSPIQAQIAALGRYCAPAEITPQIAETMTKGIVSVTKALNEGRMPEIKRTDVELYNSPSINKLLAASPEAKPYVSAFITELAINWAKLFSAGQTQTLAASMVASALMQSKLLNRISAAGLLRCLVLRFTKQGPFKDAETGYFSPDAIPDAIKAYIAYQEAEIAKEKELERKAERLESERRAEAYKKTPQFHETQAKIKALCEAMLEEAELKGDVL